MSDNVYTADRLMSDRHLPQICSIIGPLLLQPAPLELDRREATDLMILTARDMRIACRVRRGHYAAKFGNDFTFRYRRDNGARTEYEKILGGFGDWFFYGYADAAGSSLSEWMLIDLHAFREIVSDPARLGWVSPDYKRNLDGCTSFVVFNVENFLQFQPRPPILIASSRPRLNSGR